MDKGTVQERRSLLNHREKIYLESVWAVELSEEWWQNKKPHLWGCGFHYQLFIPSFRSHRAAFLSS